MDQTATTATINGRQMTVIRSEPIEGQRTNPQHTTLMLSKGNLDVLLNALNDREGILAGDYERARRAGSDALAESLRGDMATVRTLAEDLHYARQQLAA